MKATLEASAHPPNRIAVAEAEKGWLAVYLDLFKARLTVLVLLTTLVGFYLGSHRPLDLRLLLHTILGTALVASGAAALNQLWERAYDAKMRRTQHRPLPAGRLRPQTVLLVGCATSLAGLIDLALAVNPLTCLIAAASLFAYLLIYTPLKRITWLNTAVGAIPGGLPPIMGWTAARGHLSAEGWALFGILALWQVPHFMAIAWMYRDEYAKAGFRMLPVLDPQGRRTGRQAVVHALGFWSPSVFPFVLGLTGPIYFAGALLLGAAFVWCAVLFSRQLTISRARQLFYASILYLPLLLALMVLDKIR